MDPVTHAVIGLAVSKITGNSLALSDPATVGIIIGSVFPDIDILLQKWGDYAYLKNHRGVTHSIIGLGVSAAFIAVVLGLVFHSGSIPDIFMWTMLGCFSHSFIDLFNSYGAKILWPFINKKFSFSLLIIFDPVLIAVLAAYVLCNGGVEGYLAAAVPAYILLRVMMRFYVASKLKKEYGNESKSISILPSMTGLLRWHFVIEEDEYNIIGEKNILRKGTRIIKKLHKLQDETVNKVSFSRVGKFFSEFTPLFHIVCENVEGIKRYIFIDLRYYIKNNFLHHAVLELDRNNTVVKETFNPYSINRSTPLSMN